MIVSQSILVLEPILLKILFSSYYFILFERAQTGGGAEEEEEADSPLSKEPDSGLYPRTLGL